MERDRRKAQGEEQGECGRRARETRVNKSKSAREPARGGGGLCLGILTFQSFMYF